MPVASLVRLPLRDGGELICFDHLDMTGPVLSTGPARSSWVCYGIWPKIDESVAWLARPVRRAQSDSLAPEESKEMLPQVEDG
jgi:hypothetical protein